MVLPWSTGRIKDDLWQHFLEFSFAQISRIFGHFIYNNLTKLTISLFRHLLPNDQSSRQPVIISQQVKEDSRCPVKGMSPVEVW